MNVMPFVYDDGGRELAGYRGHASDCVCRSICIVTGLPYDDVYRELALGNATQRRRRCQPRGERSARNGISTGRVWFKRYMERLGFEWVPTMGIGSGCRVHLAAGELPSGRLVVRVSGHLTAVVDGVIRDTFDPQRRTTEIYPNGEQREYDRCVYGYWRLAR